MGGAGWGFGLDRHYLSSRVARRIFAVILACALLPICLFAVFSYRAVGGQLQRDAQLALATSAKAAGMSVVERLMLAEEALRLHAEATPQGETPAELHAALRSLERLEPASPGLDGLTPEQRARLESGGSVLREDSARGTSRLRMLSAVSGRIWSAQLEPGYLFHAGHTPDAGRLWVLDRAGRALYSSHGEPPPRSPGPGGAERLDVAGEPSLMLAREVFLAGSFGAPAWTVVMSRPRSEIERPLARFDAVFPWVAGIALLGALGLSLVQVRRTLVPIETLTRAARRVAQDRSFDGMVEVETRDEFATLADAFNQMTHEIGEHVGVLSVVNHVGAALSAERDEGALLERILSGLIACTGASGALVYLVDEVGELSLARSDLPGVDPRGEVPQPPWRVLAHWLQTGNAFLSRELGETEVEEWRHFEPVLGGTPSAYLAMSLRDETGESLGIVLLIRQEGGFDGRHRALAQSLASQAAVTLRKNRLVESFRQLFEGLIHLTVSAIDQKSPYTGDHCRKVPILTELLTEAVCEDRTGPYKDVILSSAERYELAIAALLHDCGKVVTPVHVIDKSTKLETIYDRLALVELRTELLRRDAVIRRLAERLGEGSEAIPGGDGSLEREFAELDADLEFVRKCNTGSEWMSDELLEQLREVAGRHAWTDRRGQRHGWLEEDELENLSIRRGTLNPEERRVIEEHVVSTMSMLEELPFPPAMRNVPYIAGAHHERLDGTGYPLQLRGEQLSLQARILGLADVFEALTAIDRPYKPGRTLGETLRILESMADEGHIDPDLLELFLREKLHLRYAVENVRPDQIDAEFQAELEELTGP